MKRRGENGDGRIRKSSGVKKDDSGTIVLWRKPVLTLEYSLKEVIHKLSLGWTRVQSQRTYLALGVCVVAVLVGLTSTPGPHQPIFQAISKKLFWCLYWIGLGVLSSIGLGTGLHTFILYLGPHIASVTLAAYECGALNFPEPPYPDQIVCPSQPDPSWLTSVWNIMRKVHLEAIMWGAGTALGELPPYFMARAARLSGRHDEDEPEDLKEWEELQARRVDDPGSLSLIEKTKLFVEDLVNKVGFFGILVCASIPNPLFDLAGITCGHFLVPFWTFAGATLIGKAVIKMSLQMMFVIMAFNESLVDRLMDVLAALPVVGPSAQNVLARALAIQRERLHRDTASSAPPPAASPLQSFFEILVLGMILYFLISIVNSLAQSYHKRVSKATKNKNRPGRD